MSRFKISTRVGVLALLLSVLTIFVGGLGLWGIAQATAPASAVTAAISRPENARLLLMSPATARSSRAPRALERSGVTPMNTPRPNSMTTT